MHTYYNDEIHKYLVKNPSEESKRLLVVILLREKFEEPDDKVLIGEELFTTLRHTGILGENLLESLQVCSLNITFPHN